ncbi:MAG: RluA family pseudouridine synthase [Bacilli bacterium]|nr:RluA family pseudouridine synthase [Bacilli bacterium]
MILTDNLKILYEDNHIIVVLKAADILSQSDSTGDLDMLNAVKHYLKIKYQKPGRVYLGLVHRLDRRVGGLMVFAKTSKAAGRLAKAIRGHQFTKQYIALVAGEAPTSGELIDYLVKTKSKGRPLAQAVDPETDYAKKAVLKYRKINSFYLNNNIFTFLLIDLLTGRYNQIRKQLALSGYPIINDFKYGYRGKNYDNCLGLFCYRLTFIHPTKSETIDIKYYPSDWLWVKMEGVDI